MKKILHMPVILVFFIMCTSLFARIDLVTLPERDSVQLTIYNSADLTLVRDGRTLTLSEGENNLQFSWANTLIDPTSIDLMTRSRADVNIMELSFPPRVRDLGEWRIYSRSAGRVPMEINYFTSGISWRAYYMATLSPGEDTMEMQGYVRVTNRSGEDYRDAQVRVIVGEINLLDRIADLARRRYPYGTPDVRPPDIPRPEPLARDLVMESKEVFLAIDAAAAPKEIVKEGLSEYFLYTIEGTENIPDGWSKRLLSFSQENIPVKNFYRYEAERYGRSAVRFISFANDSEHRMGDEPLPDGLIKVFKNTDTDSGHLSYIGQDHSDYIPVGEKVELNMGKAIDVSVEPVLMGYRTKNFLFNNPDGNISGWDEERHYEITVSNYRQVPVEVEVTRNLPHQYWDMSPEGDFDQYLEVDINTVRFTVELMPMSEKTFGYTVTHYEGDRRDTR